MNRFCPRCYLIEFFDSSQRVTRPAAKQQVFHAVALRIFREAFLEHRFSHMRRHGIRFFTSSF